MGVVKMLEAGSITNNKRENKMVGRVLLAKVFYELFQFSYLRLAQTCNLDDIRNRNTQF